MIFIQLKEKIEKAMREKGWKGILEAIFQLVKKKPIIMISSFGGIAAVFIVLLAVFAIIIKFYYFDTEFAMAQESGTFKDISTEAHADYVDKQKNTFKDIPVKNTSNQRSYSEDNSYIDEQEFRIPWQVMESLDFIYYDKKADADARNDMYNGLKPREIDDEIVYDTYITTKIIEDENGNEKDGSSSTTYKKRRKINSITTWAGTFARTYTTQNYSNIVYIKGQKCRIDQTVWVFTTNGEPDYKLYKDYELSLTKKLNKKLVKGEQEDHIKRINELIASEQSTIEGEDLPEWLQDYQSDIVYMGGDFMWPVPSTDVTSCYGPRHRHWDTGAVTLHNGIDISEAGGTPIKASKDGKIISAFYDSIGGNTIIIDHGKDADGRLIKTEYCHMSRFAVSQGQMVNQGDVIGYVGTTGSSTGNHLHFIIIEGTQKVNPGIFFKIDVKGNSCIDKHCGNNGANPGNNYGKMNATAVASGMGFTGGPFTYPLSTADRKIYRNYTETEGSIDYDVAIGTPVLAANDGTVVLAQEVKNKDGSPSYGMMIRISHGDDSSGKAIETIYAHLSSIDVKKGEKVTKGDVIGYSGNTGATGGKAMLHFEVREDNKWVDPTPYLNGTKTLPTFKGITGSAEAESYIQSIPNSKEEMDLFIRLVAAEGSDTELDSKGVTEVVLNRLRSPAFNYKPKNLYTVIYAGKQFAVTQVAKGEEVARIDRPVDSRTYTRLGNIIKGVIQGKTSYVGGATYFCSYKAGSDAELDWMARNRVKFVVQYGGNRFYAPISR